MFRFLTAGESHGQGLVAIIEGVPAGLALDEDYIAKNQRRRQQGYGRGARMAIEEDRAEIASGVRHGVTMGSPIALLILNRDWENWKQVMSVIPVEQEVEPVTRLRPGHAGGRIPLWLAYPIGGRLDPLRHDLSGRVEQRRHDLQHRGERLELHAPRQ